LLGLGALGLSLVDLMTFNYHVIVPGIAPGLVLMAIVGIPVAGMIAGATTLMQLSTDDAYRGRVLGAYGAVGALSSLIGATLGGFLGDRVGIVTMLNVQALGYGLAGGLALVALRGVSLIRQPGMSPLPSVRESSANVRPPPACGGGGLSG
jgi:hypothetical protein